MLEGDALLAELAKEAVSTYEEVEVLSVETCHEATCYACASEAQTQCCVKPFDGGNVG